LHKYVLAANYSKQLIELIGEDLNIVDAVKVSEFNSLDYINDYIELRKIKPIFIHGLAQGVSPGELSFKENVDLDLLKSTLALTDTKYISFHLQCVLGYGQEINSDDFLERFINDSAYVREVTNLPIHLENTHFYFPSEGKNNNAAFICEPNFIKQALAKTSSEFLLDIGHAQIAAWHLGINPIEYINSLPMHLIEEVHITGPIMVGNEPRDKHQEISEEGYNLLEYILNHANIKTITIEYGGVGKSFEERSDKKRITSYK